jgi:long-subunit acyl-CoA synthetase (AMP-forming)
MKRTPMNQAQDGPIQSIADVVLERLPLYGNGPVIRYDDGSRYVNVPREADADKTLEDEIKKLKRQGVRIRCLMAVPKFWYFLLKEILEEMNGKPVYRILYRHLRAIETSDHFYDIGTLDKAKLVAARTLLRNKLGGFFAFGFSSSSKMEPGVVDIFAKLGITIVDVYGATEAAGVIAKNELNRTRRGFCGRLLDGFEYRLANVRKVDGLPYPVGELFIRGPGIARGYLGPNASFPVGEDGFYATGDIAYVDGDKWVFWVGRKKELIERIYLLSRSLERTPTHKIKFVSEIGKLDRSVYV